MKHKILVTGGTGLVGHFAVEELLRRSYSVRILTRAESVPKTQLRDVEFAVGDLSDPVSLHDAMIGINGVVHSACTFRDSSIDTAAMQLLLRAWREGPFVFISSLDVYGIPSTRSISESHPLSREYNDYGTGKVICEELLQQKAADDHRSDFMILRAAFIWGPHPRARQRLMKQQLQDGKEIVLPGSSEDEWQSYCDAWIDARDLAWIIAEALEHPTGEALNTLSGHFVWHDLYAQLIAITRSQSTIHHKAFDEITEEELPKKILYAQRWHFSDQKLRSKLRYVSRFSLQQTLQDTVNTM